MSKELKGLPNDPVIDEQKYIVISFITPKQVKGLTEAMFMFRGAYATEEEARERAKYLQTINGDFNIYICEGFKWCYFNDDINKATDVVYKEERLNEIMNDFKKQQEKMAQMEKDRQNDLIAEMEKDNKVKKYENSDNPTDKIKLTLKEKMEKINQNEIKKSEDNIKEIDENMNKLKEAMDKLNKE